MVDNGKKRVEYVPYGSCPNCGSETTEYEFGYYEDGMFIDIKNCPRCNFKWRVISRYEYSQEE